MRDTELPAGVAEHLGHYVYLYIDPRDGKPFYVGKGKGRRMLAHFDDERDSDKTRILQELWAAGLEPRLEILSHGMRDDETALRVEAAVIDLLGIGALTNAVRGWKSLEMGRMTLDELIGYYAAEPVEVTHPAILIRINKLYRHNMTPLELYEATRGRWRIGLRRENAKFALAVFEGVVREVYRIDQWHPAHSTEYRTRDVSTLSPTGRWEFTGERADTSIRSLYVGRSVKHYFRQGQQSPVCYVNS